MRIPALFSLLFALLLSVPAMAQDDGVGTVYGRIMGGLQPAVGAEVVIMQKDQLFDRQIVDENGNYRFAHLRPGYYDVRATMQGYRTSIIIHVPVTGHALTKNDFYLPQFNTANMQANPIVETYEDNCRNYMRNRTYRTRKERRLGLGAGR